MKWSWRIMRVSGIGIYIHVTFLLMPLWIGWTHFAERGRWADAAVGVAFVMVLFGIVVLHELGHAFTARRFGIRTRDITLLPIGGVARLERMPEDPKQELLVALAGPAVNLCLAGLLFALLGATRQVAQWTTLSMPGRNFAADLMWVNLGLAVFNLVPAFPMDGGRVLRALLAMRVSYARATRVAASFGQFIALLFGFVGLSSLLFGRLGPFSNPFLLFIGLFVWLGAAQEAGLVKVKSALNGLPVSRLMITDFRSLSPADQLGQAVDYLLSGWQHDFPVIEEGRVVGLLTRAALVNGLAQGGREKLVSEVMLRNFPAVNPGDAADVALLKLGSDEGRTILVVRDGKTEGLLTRENVNEYLLVHAALDRH